MMSPHPSTRIRLALAASALAAFGFATAPAHAASFTVFWDRAAFNGFAAGYGVSAATAQAASNAGIPIVTTASVVSKPDAVVVNHALDQSTLNPSFPLITDTATITSNWSATNNTDLNNGQTPAQNLYLVYERPVANTIDLNGQPQSVTYDPADVGLLLSNDGNGGGVDWVILQIPVANNTSVYYPAVSLGTLAHGATAAYPLFYTLENPQVFTENFNYELGMPKWTLDFVSFAVPEPSSGTLLIAGLVALAGGRRKRS